MGARMRSVERFDRDQRGVTLVEMSITMALLLAVTIPAVNFLASTQRSQKISDQATAQQQEARLAIDQFTRQLREAGYPDGHTYSDSQIFLSATDNDVTFYTDVDNDRVNERMRYYLDTDTNTLMRTVTEPDCAVSPCDYGSLNATSVTRPVISYVRNTDLTACAGQSGSKPLFTYYKKDVGTGGRNPSPIATPIGNINDLVDVYYLDLTVVVDVTPGKSPTCQTLSTAVQLRNWRG